MSEPTTSVSKVAEVLESGSQLVTSVGDSIDSVIVGGVSAYNDNLASSVGAMSVKDMSDAEVTSYFIALRSYKKYFFCFIGFSFNSRKRFTKAKREI
jgi:hypothetical protein